MNEQPYPINTEQPKSPSTSLAWQQAAQSDPPSLGTQVMPAAQALSAWISRDSLTLQIISKRITAC